MNPQKRIHTDENDTAEMKAKLIEKIMAEADASGLSTEAVLNALFVSAANLVVHVTPEHSDYIPVRSFRQVLESIRKQFKAAKEKTS